MKIKALSLWQPWASLVALGVKRYETRSWATNYRGPLLICAAKGGLCTGAILELIEKEPAFQKALELLLPPDHKNLIPYDYLWGMKWGCALAIVELSICYEMPNNYLLEKIKDELPFGDFSAGRFAWKLENVRAIKPFPVKGCQGLFEVEIPESFEREL